MSPEYQSPEETFAKLKEEYRLQPDRLKFIEAQEKIFFSSRPGIKDEDIMGVLMDGLKNWVENPLDNEPLAFDGFARLIQEIQNFESDDFSAKAEKISADDALLIANVLVEQALNRTLSGALIAEAHRVVREKK